MVIARPSWGRCTLSTLYCTYLKHRLERKMSINHERWGLPNISHNVFFIIVYPYIVKKIASSMGVTAFLWVADNLYVNFRSPNIIFAGAKLKFQTSNAIKRHGIIGSLDYDVRKGNKERCPACPLSLMPPVNLLRWS